MTRPTGSHRLHPVTAEDLASAPYTRAIQTSLRTFAAAASALVSLLLLAPASPALARPASFSEPLTLVSSPAAKRANPPRQAERAPARAPLPLLTVQGTAPGQAGFVHYFVITDSDGERESQIGIELPGDRIAWSFPGIGASVSPFIKAGTISVDGKSFEVEHLYGIRPFRTEEAMRVLRRDVAERVRVWVDEKTPYCDELTPSHAQCLSCLGFVMRVLWPGTTRNFAAPPADFKTARRDMYTTEDLLLYLTGVPIDAPRTARLRRIEALNVPEDMREELVRVASVEHEGVPVARQRTPGRSVVQVPRRTNPATARGGS